MAARAHASSLARVLRAPRLAAWQCPPPVRGAPLTRCRRAQLRVRADASAPAVKRPQLEALSVPGAKPGRDLQLLEATLGYSFRRPELLEQACTQPASAASTEASYRQLALLGDASLWLLFAEHALSAYGPIGEDPSSGGWPACMSGLLSRASCAKAAREWGLQPYLQHSSGGSELAGSSSCSLDGTANSGGSSSSSGASRHGLLRGAWTSDALAEMFEGLVGALVLDCGFAATAALLQPWVAASFEASRAHTAGHAGAGPGAGSSSAGGQAAAAPQPASCAEHEQLQALESALESALAAQVQAACGYCFADRSLLVSCARQVLGLLQHGTGGAETEAWRFLGFGLLQFAAAMHASTAAAAAGGTVQQPGAWSGEADSRAWNAPWQPLVAAASAGAVSGSSSAGSSSAGSSSGSVRAMAKQLLSLKTVRHRCKMWLWLGLDPVAALRLAPGCHLLSVRWKSQKQLLARCLDLLLAAVCLDGGREAALGLAAAALAGTPPTVVRIRWLGAAGMCKAWIPAWRSLV